MTPEERLRREDLVAHRAFTRIRTLLSKRSEWRPEFALGLAALAPTLSAYLRTAHEARREDLDLALRKELEALAEEQRQIARDALVEFAVLDPELVRFAVVNAEGLDATISALCAPLDLEAAYVPQR